MMDTASRAISGKNKNELILLSHFFALMHLMHLVGFLVFNMLIIL